MFGLERRIITLILIFIILIFISILTISVSITQTYSEDNDTHYPNTIQENFIKNQGRVDYSTSPSTRASAVNLIINKNQSREFNDDRIVNNVTIRDDATLIIKDCEFWIKGTLLVKDNGRLFVLNSTLHIDPGPMNMHQIIVNFSDNAHIKISDSQLFTHPQCNSTPTNISYLLSDANSEVTIINSYLNIKLPKIVNLDIDLTPPTAGTFILTGETIWNIQNCTIESYLYYENGELIGRWFIFTLQGRAKLFIKDSVGSLENSETNPFIKPVAGFVRLENTKIRMGVIDNEVIGEVEAINLTISHLNLRDQTKTKVLRSEIVYNVDLGGVAIYSPTAVEGSEKPKATLSMEDSVIGTVKDPNESDGIFFAIGNSTSTIKRCTFNQGILQAEAKVNIINCSINQFIEGSNNGQITMENSSVEKIFLGENCRLMIHSNLENPPINTLSTKFNSKSEISANNVKIKTLEVWPGDNIPPENYGPDYDPDLNISKISVNLINSNLEKVKASDDAEIFFTLQESQINEFAFDIFKNEKVMITILDLGSDYIIPKPWPEVELEINIYHRIQLETYVNDKFVKSFISVKNENDEEVKKSYTNDNGKLALELFSKKHTSSGTEPAGEYSIYSTYLGFSKQEKVKSKIGEDLVIAWEDYNSPVISDIFTDTSYQTTERGTYVQTSITDLDVKLVSNATIYYQSKNDGSWSEWKSTPMVEIDDNLYEGSIPQVEPGTKVRYYIESYDILGNKAESEKHSYEIEDTKTISTLVFVLFIFVIIFLILLFIFKRRAKLKKYLNKPKTDITRESNDN